jgi:7-keto-8-aminopelargonate synthetase-like enzyme
MSLAATLPEVGESNVASARTAWPTLDGKIGGRTVVDGREFIMFASNDYLGLATHPTVLARARAALDEFGAGTGINPGRAVTRIHRELSEAMVEFTGCEDVLLFNSCTAANCAIIATLVGPTDVVLSDELNHASIVDGCRLARGRTIVYRHCDVTSLRRKLTAASRARLRLVISDGVFSMEAEILPLPEILAAVQAAKGVLVVDESHSAGVVGIAGRGSAELYDISPRAFIQTGTFSKAFGAGIGGYVAGDRDLIAHLRLRARFFNFTSTMPAVNAAAALGALEVLRASPDLPARAKANAGQLRAGLEQRGFRVQGGEHHPSTLVLIGESARTRLISRVLFDHGVFAPAVVYPVVPENAARLRLQVSASHTDSDIEAALKAFDHVRPARKR